MFDGQARGIVRASAAATGIGDERVHFEFFGPQSSMDDGAPADTQPARAAA